MGKKSFIFSFIFLLSVSAFSQTADDYYNAGKTAFEEQHFDEAWEQFQERFFAPPGWAW